MKIAKMIIKFFGIIIGTLLAILLLICIWHNISNIFENKNVSIPGDGI